MLGEFQKIQEICNKMSIRIFKIDGEMPAFRPFENTRLMPGRFIEDACGPLPLTTHRPGDDTGAPAEDGHVLGLDCHLTSPYLQLYCMYTNN